MEKCRWLIGVFKIGGLFCVQYEDGSISRMLTASQAWRVVGTAILCIPAWARGTRWGPFSLN